MLPTLLIVPPTTSSTQLTAQNVKGIDNEARPEDATASQ